MAKKKTKRKTVKKSPKRKTPTKKKKRSTPKTRTKEVVRVKTFIVEKPVYVEAPSRFQRLKEKIPLYSGNESRYSKQKEEKYQEDPMQEESFENENYDEPVEEPLDESLEDQVEDPMDESLDEPVEESQDAKSHIRSRGLFKNIWWKKGLLKGFFVWILIVIFVYILDLFGMAEVVDVKRWVFFLVLLLILGMGYQKYISGKVDF
jgi:hypothetical protein